MPIYEYQCESCAHQFETIQKVSDPVLTDCPECGDAALKKLVSPAAFRLKGSGWYETDFKSNNKKNVVESATADSGASDSSGDDSSKKESASSGSDRKESASKSESKKKGGDDQAA